MSILMPEATSIEGIDDAIDKLREMRAEALRKEIEGDLLPCPFCGAPGRLNPMGCGVECTNKECSAFGPSLYETGETECREAVKRWNKRVKS